MPSLREIQLDFIDAIFNESSQKLERHLAAEKLTPERQIDIYKNNVFNNLIDSLKIAYPVILKLMGEEFFDYVGEDYVRQTPSIHGNLQKYGDKFPTFLSNLKSVEGLPYIADVATLEWDVHQIFFAGDHLSLDFNKLTSAPVSDYGSLVFKLHPAIRLMRSIYPIHKIWENNQDGFTGNTLITLDEGDFRLMVKRSDYQIQPIIMSEGEFEFLFAISEGSSLLDANEMAQKTYGDLDLSSTLNKFIADSILVDVVV